MIGDTFRDKRLNGLKFRCVLYANLKASNYFIEVGIRNNMLMSPVEYREDQ